MAPPASWSQWEPYSCPLSFRKRTTGASGFPREFRSFRDQADRRGRPIAVQAYPGTTAVHDRVEALHSRFGMQRLVLVVDRCMLTDTQIEHLRQYRGLGWISALWHDAIRKLADEQSVQMSLFDQRSLAEIRSPLYPVERLVACSNPALAARPAQARGGPGRPVHHPHQPGRPDGRGCRAQPTTLSPLQRIHEHVRRPSVFRGLGAGAAP